MRYKIFGRRTGLRVSQLALGTSDFGTGWGHGDDRDEARNIFDRYVEEPGEHWLWCYVDEVAVE